MVTWVVMEAFIGAQKVWAWGLVNGGPGFDELRLTSTDGMTPVDMPDDGLKMGAHLFSVPAGDEAFTSELEGPFEVLHLDDAEDKGSPWPPPAEPAQ